MLRGLLSLFIVVPLVEVYLLTLLVRATSFWFTLALTIVTGVIGGFLAKREGLRVWARWQAALSRMQAPEEGVVGGLLVLAGGVLLITPGVLTDIVGLALLIPATRRRLAGVIRKRLDAKLHALPMPPYPGYSATNGDDPEGMAQRTGHGDRRPKTIITSGTSIDS